MRLLIRSGRLHKRKAFEAAVPSAARVRRAHRNSMRPSAFLLVVIICVSAVWLPTSAAQQEDGRSPALGKIKQATSVAIDCSACPRALAKAGTTAKQELIDWKRFRIVNDPKEADLIFMFSGNPYLGDYLTRKGPDTRVVKIDVTIMTVIDPHTGQELWSDSRRWGSLRVAGATKSLIDELRSDLESEFKKWTLDDVLRCSGTPAYQPFAYATPEAALVKPELGVSRVADSTDRLGIYSASAPDFCRRAQLVIGPNNKIDGFEVVASQADTLDVADILEQADRFQFTSGKDPRTQKVYFTAQTRDKRVVIQFEVQGHRTVLSRVSYAY